MMEDHKTNSSPNQLKEKIEKLRIELEQNQNSINESVKYEPDPNEDGLTHISQTKQGYLVVIEDLENEIDLLLKDNARLREEKLIALADGENLKKRLQEELDDVKYYRAYGIAENLLPALDNFERALQVTNVSEDVKNFLTGFEMIYKMIKASFTAEGIVEMDVNVGDTFDSRFHAAVEIVETEDVQSEQIATVLQKGYMLHDRVLRYASVAVAK